ncbi:unnamed protein product [Orchesella dallaii]|uniref:Uncharacterized protein n=1 Tax=Orchesella dallaii TaxID=48710 RepID=A0ABP1RAF8_9HEXA
MQDEKFWSGVGGNIIALNLRASSIFMTITKIITSICAAYNPRLPWNPLCAIVIYFELASSGDNALWEIRTVIFGTLWISWGFFGCFVVVVYYVNFMTIVFCLKCAILAFRRQFELSSHVTPKQIMMYRQVQLLIDNFNHIHKTFMMGFIIFSVVITIVLSANLLILSNENLDFKAILVIGPIFLNCLITLDSFRFPAAIHAFSIETKKWTESNVLTRISGSQDKAFLKWATRYWKSFPPFKIQFFSSNYFERLTPLIILDFCLTLVINMSLVR